ncbi:MFS transporter, partial [Escherichia coli]
STYIIVYYLSNYAVSVLHMPLSLGIWAACIAALVQVVLSPFAGRLADRVGRRKVVLWSRVALLAMIYPAFALINAD